MNNHLSIEFVNLYLPDSFYNQNLTFSPDPKLSVASQDFMRKIFILIIIFSCMIARTQVIYEDINNVEIYDFLDELANLKVIETNSVVKPYSRQYIAKKLLEAKQYVEGHEVMKSWGHDGDGGDGSDGSDGSGGGKKDNKRIQLNKRQMKELMFYWQDYQLDAGCRMTDTGDELRITNYELRINSDNAEPGTRNPELATSNQKPATDCLPEYDHKLGFLFKNKPNFAVPLNPLAFQYKDRLFTLSVRPILGITYMVNENGSALHKYWGGSMFGYIGKNFGFYASLRDNNESVGLEYPEYFTFRQGQIYKPGSKSGVDFSEMKGGVVVSWNWGSFGLVKDRIMWGNNYHGANILSGKAPSFPYILLHLRPAKWIDFTYIHGWLNSNVIDSSRSYFEGNSYRVVYRNKYIAANMFTLIPWRGLNVSFGNSIVYSDVNIQPAFLIPFMFFNSIDATNSDLNNDAGQNSQIFFDISSRQIRHLHLWVTLFIDELKVSRVFSQDALNWTSWKAGFRVNDFPLQNVSFTVEWTKTNPITYKHYIQTTTFSSSDYCMGNYLRDNSQEIYLALAFKPLRGLHLNASYTIAQHGDEYPDNRSYDYTTLRFIKNKTWQNSEVAVSARYEYTANGYFFLEYLNSAREGDVVYQPGFMHGKTNTIVAGVNIGF